MRHVAVSAVKVSAVTGEATTAAHAAAAAVGTVAAVAVAIGERRGQVLAYQLNSSKTHHFPVQDLDALEHEQADMYNTCVNVHMRLSVYLCPMPYLELYMDR